MKINAIRVNNINSNYKKNIAFKANNNDYTDNTAVLTLQGSDKFVNFQRFEEDLNKVKKADAVQSNVFTALFNKIKKAVKMMFGPSPEYDEQIAIANSLLI